MFEIIPVYHHRYLHFHPVPPLNKALATCKLPPSESANRRITIDLPMSGSYEMNLWTMEEYIDRRYIYIWQLSDLNRYKS